MGHGLKVLVTAGLLALVPVQVVSASIIMLEIGGSANCGRGAMERGYCGGGEFGDFYDQQMEAFSAATGFPIQDNGTVWATFSMLLAIDMAADPIYEATGIVRMGTLSFSATGRILVGLSGCDGDSIFFEAQDSLLRGATNLCSKNGLALEGMSWQEIAALTVADMASISAGYDEYDKHLIQTDPQWSVMWGASYIRVVPEPSTLALFGLGLAGLGFARRRKRR